VSIGELEPRVLSLLDKLPNNSHSVAAIITYMRENGVKEHALTRLRSKSPSVRAEWARVKTTERKTIDVADVIHGEQRRFLAAAHSRKISMTDYARRIASHPAREYTAEVVAIIELLADHIDYLQDHVEQLEKKQRKR